MQGAEKVSKPRIGTLSDMIFALALSIGTIGLVSNTPSQPSDIVSSVAAFGFSFYILITIWLRYTNLASVLPIETPGLIMLNGVLLFSVAIEPYLLNLLFKSSTTNLWPFSSTLYALDLAILFTILGLFTHTLAVEEKNLIPKASLHEFKLTRDFEWISAAIWVFSTLPIFAQYSLGSTL